MLYTLLFLLTSIGTSQDTTMNHESSIKKALMDYSQVATSFKSKKSSSPELDIEWLRDPDRLQRLILANTQMSIAVDNSDVPEALASHGVKQKGSSYVVDQANHPEWVYFHDFVLPYQNFFEPETSNTWSEWLNKGLKDRGFSQPDFELLKRIMADQSLNLTIKRKSRLLVKQLMRRCQRVSNKAKQDTSINLKEEIRYYRYLIRSNRVQARHDGANELFDQFDPRAQRILISFAKETFISEVRWTPSPDEDNPAVVMDVILSGKLLGSIDNENKKEELDHEN